MNEARLLPLRVPELGPSLGKLVSGTERPTHWIPLDTVRYRLATRIIEAAGEARRLAAGNECSAVLAALDHTVWQAAWDEAVTSIAETVAERVSTHLESEARAVKMDKRRRAKLQLDQPTKRAIAARLGSVGAGLLPVLDAIDARAAAALEATALERGAVEEWQETQKLAARRLEAAWLALEQALDRENTRWRSVADEVARWRKPMWPVAVMGAVLLAIAVWLGLVFGGYVESPHWLSYVWVRVFGR